MSPTCQRKSSRLRAAAPGVRALSGGWVSGSAIRGGIEPRANRGVVSSAGSVVRAATEPPAPPPSTIALPVGPPAPVTAPSAPRATVEVPPKKTSTPAPPPASATGGRPHIAPTPSDSAPELSTSGDGMPSGQGEVRGAASPTPGGTDTLEESEKAAADSVRKGGGRASTRQSEPSTTRPSISPADVVALRRWVAYIWPAVAFLQGEKGKHMGDQS